MALFVTGLIPLAQAGPADDRDPLPPWDHNELVAKVTRGITPSNLKSVRLLAWHTREDGRPVRYDAALFWIHYLLPSGGKRWALAILARHPLDTPPLNIWVFAFQGHEWQPLAVFESPPSNKDVYKFIDGHWTFEPDSSIQVGNKLVDGKWIRDATAGFRILAGAVRSQTWLEVIGERPTKFHRGEVKAGK